MSDKLAKVDPQVSSLARPESGPLLAARQNIKRQPDAQAIFAKSREENWNADQLAEALQPVLELHVEGDSAAIAQVARYLADEYFQIGDGILIISTETGKAIAKITEDDIWVPPPVPREGGGMVQPLPRLRPELEGLLVEWVFNRGREQALAATLARRSHQTALLREEGDRRLLPVTKAGRRQIVDAISDALRELLPGQCQGLSREFLSHFEFRQDDPEDLKPLLRCVGLSKSLIPLQDPRGLNLRHDHFTAVTARIASQWTREIARSVAVFARQELQPRPMAYRDLKPENVQGAFWTGEPNTVELFHKTSPGVSALPVDGAPPTGFSGIVGAIVIDPASYKCSTREFHDRWEIMAKFEYTVWIDWAKVRSLVIDDVPMSGLSVEVLDRAR